MGTDMHTKSYLPEQLSFGEICIFMAFSIFRSRLRKINIQWPMGHSGNDAIYIKPHKMKTHGQNQLKIAE